MKPTNRLIRHYILPCIVASRRCLECELLQEDSYFSYDIFIQYIEENLDDICDDTDTRWLVSICDTIIDHDKTERATRALVVNMYANMVKFWSTCRDTKNLLPIPIRIKPTYDGLYRANYVIGDTFEHLITRAYNTIGDDKVIEKIFTTILFRSVNDPKSPVNHHLLPHKYFNLYKQLIFERPKMEMNEVVDQYSQLHMNDPKYGNGNAPLGLKLFGKWGKGRHVLDYGCGKGKLVQALNKNGIVATGYDPGIEKFSHKPDHSVKFDTIICLDVMEHFPSNLVTNVLFDIKKYDCKNFIFNISCRPAFFKTPNGHNCHLTVWRPSQWHEVLERVFTRAQFHVAETSYRHDIKDLAVNIVKHYG